MHPLVLLFRGLPVPCTNANHISLILTHHTPSQDNAGICTYGSSKPAVIGFTKTVGKEFAETDSTVNTLAPAVVMTPMVEAMEPAQVKYMNSSIN